jgi:hypothetical protein
MSARLTLVIILLINGSFADVHYYFNDPSSKPLHHRFSKGSYTYVYHNSTQGRAKLEIANHAGSPDQDAFFGSLNAVKSLRYSYKQPTLFNLVLDAASISTQDEWHLGTYDVHNQQKYLYKIHTIDLYLWTEKDAATLLSHLQSILPSEKLDIRNAPISPKAGLAEHRDSMSPVVQLLEKTAIGTHFHPRAESTASVHSFPGPPASAQSGGLRISPPPAQQQPLHQPAPLAYNPAAPSAPEPIAHREKTPPPVDDASGSVAPSAMGYGSTQYATVPFGFQPSLQGTPQQSYFSGPPQAQQRQSSYGSLPGPPHSTPPSNIQRTQSGSLPPPPPPPGQTGPSPAQYTPSFGPPPISHSAQPASPPPTQTSFNRQSSFGLPVQQFASYGPQSPGFLNHQQQQQQQPPTPSVPPSYTTHTPLQSPGLPPQQQAAQIAGYSSFSYSQPQQQATPGAYNPHGAYTGDVHNQLYRPTEGESAPPVLPPGQERKDGFSGKYKVNERVDKVEKGVGRFLKKLDSKW